MSTDNSLEIKKSFIKDNVNLLPAKNQQEIADMIKSHIGNIEQLRKIFIKSHASMNCSCIKMSMIPADLIDKIYQHVKTNILKLNEKEI